MRNVFEKGFVLSFLLGTVSAAQPPHLRAEVTSVAVSAGQNASLNCPVTKNFEFLEWFKGGESVNRVNARFKFTSKGGLRIIKVNEEDAGLYRCQAVNGFGVASAYVTLVILSTRKPEYDERDNFSPDSGLVPLTNKGKPRFKDGHPKEGRVIQRPTESSVVFRCHPHGQPIPLVNWFKDGLSLRESGDNRVKIYRWKIELNYLKLTDSGVYTCTAYNEHGSANLNYTLRVIRTAHNSEFMGQDPVNTTVYENGVANFQCRVRSAVKPHMTWLKLVPDDHLKMYSDKLIPFNGKFYQVLNSSEMLEHPDGSFLNKLHITKTSVSDTGKYVCLAASTRGYIYRIAHLKVIGPVMEPIGSITANSITVILTISLTALILLACAVVSLRYVHFKPRRDTSTGSEQTERASSKRLIRSDKEGSLATTSLHPISTPTVKVHHHPKTHHHHFIDHYHQHDHHLGDLKR